MRGMLLFVVMALAVSPASARIYKWVLPDGTITYSDQPQPGAERVELSPLQTYSQPPVASAGGGDTGDADGAPAQGGGYEEFKVASPENDAVIRDTGGTVAISLSLKPALRDGDEVEILMDGEALGKGRGTSISLSNVDRGSHQVSANVKDGEGKVVARAAPITFHLKRGRR